VSPLARLRHSELARLAGLIAVLLQLGFSTLHDPDAAGPATPFGICHVGSGGSGTVPPTAPGTKPQLCPACLCLQASAAALVPPAAGVIAWTRALASGATFQNRDRPLAVRTPNIPAQPRAPPQFA
jgi:hypothetical protein